MMEVRTRIPLKKGEVVPMTLLLEMLKQIAELFPETTIMFADIAGFTAWASSREPSHVFTLLETLYGAFDRQAKRMGESEVWDRWHI
jgi:class 3 adenylate cyclase